MIIVRSTLQYGALLFFLLLINFALPRLAPGSPLDYMLGGEDAAALSSEERHEVLQEFGLQLPLTDQFLHYFSGVFSGELGNSVSMGMPVSEVLLDRVGWTLLLMGTAWILSAMLGILAGVLCSLYVGRTVDVSLLYVFLISSSVPPFWIGMLMIIVFSVSLSWLPSFGAYPIAVPVGSLEYIVGVGKRLIMPALSIAIVHAGAVMLTTRSSVLLALEQDYIFFAKSQGLSTSRIFLSYALRNAAMPIYTHMMVGLGSMLSGALVIEVVFSWPGIGSLIVDAVHARDYPLLQGIFLVTGFSVVLVNFIAELSYPWLDPRQRKLL